MFNILIDTSVENSLIVFFDDLKLLYRGDPFSSIHSSKFIFSEIEKGFKSSGFEISQLAYISVCIGPGSYTGTRVGVTIAKTLSYALKIPVIPYCSLHAYIPNEYEGPFMSLIDARSGGAYYQKGLKKGDNIEWLDIPKINYLQNIPYNVEDLIVSPNLINLKDQIIKLTPNNNFKWLQKDQDIIYLDTLCKKKYLNNVFEELKILYLK